MATVITSLGSNDRNTNISAVSGSGPWTVTITDGSVAKIGDALWDEHATPRKYLITGVSGNDLTVRDSEAVGGAPDNSGTSTPVVKRYYATITLWEADLDDTGLYAASDVAQGEMYNDANFSENPSINGGSTVGLSQIILTVPESERHDGTAGTGVILNPSGNGSFFSINGDISTTVEWLELDGLRGSKIISEGFKRSGWGGNPTIILKGNIVHNCGTQYGTAYGMTLGSNTSGTRYMIHNLVYDIESSHSSSSTDAIGIGAGGASGPTQYIYNNTVYDIVKDNGTGAGADAYGILVADDVDYVVRNNISVDVGGTTSGNKVCYEPASPSSALMSYNLASDTTASGSGSLNSKTSANQFVSTVGGSEDLHLKVGADAIDAGTNLGTTPTGVEIDIDGTSRDSTNPLAARFVNANTERLSITDASQTGLDPSGHQDFYACGWVYLDNLTGNQRILTKWGAASNNSYLIHYQAGSTNFVFGVSYDGTNSTFVTATSAAPSTTTWYFWQVYHDATNDLIGISINNAAFDTAAHSTGVHDGTSSFVLGDDHATNSGLDGRLDSVAFYKGGIPDSSTRSNLYNSGLGKSYSGLSAGDKTNLTSWWNLDEASGSRADSHGSNTLTDNNTVTQATGIAGAVSFWDIGADEFVAPPVVSANTGSNLMMMGI